MKFRVARDTLADAVAWAARTLPVRPSTPVLAGIIIEAGEDGLVLSTFDYETSTRATLAADVAQEGRALVSGRLLNDICRNLPDQPVDVEVDGAKATVVCGKTRFTLRTLPLEEYPTLPDMPEASGTVPSDVFSHAVAQAVTAAGRDEMLPVLTGVRVEIEGDTITFLATDRFRLAQCEITWNPGTPGASLAALVPAKVLHDTAKALGGTNEVTLAVSAPDTGEGIIGFEGSVGGGMRRTTTRLLDGEFPKVRNLFPDQQLTVVEVEKAPLVESVRRVSLVAERNTAVQLAFADSELKLDAASGEDAQAAEVLPADIDGNDITAGFNPAYLLDGLGAIDEDRVRLAFTEPNKPVVMRGIAEEDGSPGFRYLLMPRRLLG